MQPYCLEPAGTDLVGDTRAPLPTSAARNGLPAEDRFDVENLVQRELLMMRNESSDCI